MKSKFSLGQTVYKLRTVHELDMKNDFLVSTDSQTYTVVDEIIIMGICVGNYYLYDSGEVDWAVGGDWREVLQTIKEEELYSTKEEALANAPRVE